MGGNITSAISAARQSLGTFSRSLAVVQENIANAATPGYARQRVSIAPIVTPGHAASQGIELQRVESLRSNLLDLQVSLGRQQQAQLQKTTEIFARIEPGFRLDGGGLNDALDGLFASAGRLSTNPADSNLRRGFKDSADAFASATRRLHTDISRQQVDLETEARGVARQISSIAEQIAQLEAKRSRGEGSVPNPAIETQVQQKLEELSGLVGFTTQRQRDGALAVIAGATPIVTGVRSRSFSVTLDADGLHVINDVGQDVTASLEGGGGRLGAILEAHNQTLPALTADINRFAKTAADQVNRQLELGVDLAGQPGAPLFEYDESAVSGSGRTAGATGAATPAPPPSVTVDFSNGLTGSVSANLDSFFVAAAASAGVSAGDTASVRLVSADGAIDRTLTTAPLGGSETAADLAIRLNDQVALAPELAGLVTFSDEGGQLKVVLSDRAKQGFTLSATTSNPAFTTGLEAGATLGGQSAEEIAAALNAEVALNPALDAARVRFVAVNGELRFDADVAFDYAVTDADPAATGFASGLDGASDRAGGANAAGSITVSDIALSQIAAGTAEAPNSADNLLAIEALAARPLVDDLSLSEFFSGIVSSVGEQSEAANSDLAVQSEVTAAAVNLRDSFSGVDINEEAIEMLRFEQGYSAMLRVIQTLNQLTDEVLQLAR